MKPSAQELRALARRDPALGALLRKLPPFPPQFQTEDYLLQGCQSRVWLTSRYAGDLLHFEAISDSAIVSGLIALLMRVYNDRKPAEILATPPEFIKSIGLEEHLSPTRSNGLRAMIGAIRNSARDAAGGASAG